MNKVTKIHPLPHPLPSPPNPQKTVFSVGVSTNKKNILTPPPNTTPISELITRVLDTVGFGVKHILSDVNGHIFLWCCQQTRPV